ncbi:uncharacterized protein LOC131689841 [Topomyia yanbarensis]|uniref:uncharacterized protein LOC131689841 n=1 Tax=Topomyia yanbarensis TaxID=2498891 RepID=UPI00273A81E7|nr:uncharacterized protein LOC131689841 [Topomyia yanbarensis]
MSTPPGKGSKKKSLPYFMQRSEDTALPSFQNRRTLADHVKDNMLCAGRKSYFQRIVYIGRHPKVSAMTIRDQFLKVIREMQDKTSNEVKLFGLMINFDGYSMHMIESSEETIGEYMRYLAASDLFDCSRVVLVYNNINQRFFRKLVWRFADYLNGLEPTVIDTKDSNVVEKTINAFMVKVYTLCKMVRTEELDERTAFKSLYLDENYEEHTPDAALLEYLLSLKCLFTIQEYGQFYGVLPDVTTFRDKVWPIPQDFTPYDVFDSGKYQINLTFGNP